MDTPTLYISTIRHKNAQQVAIKFKYNDTIRLYLRKLSDLRWSKSNRAFYLSDTAENRKLLFSHLAKKKWQVDYTQLSGEAPPPPLHFNQENLILFSNYKRYLKGLRLSESSIRSYSTFIGNFILFVQPKALNLVDNTDFRLFVEREVHEKKYSISTHRQLVSAIKHFAAFNSCNIDDLNLKRPSKSKFLPNILSTEEVLDILRVTQNLKHRTILALIYSTGLRVGEVINLKLTHIDYDRKQVIIKNAKGRKDRNVGLAESFLPLLVNYYRSYRPKVYLVEGKEGKAYSASSIRAFLKKSCEKAKIKKRVTPHTLRHSYATHLLENGVGIRHIQELLGHSKPETTMLYTHVAQDKLVKIESPLDIAISKLQESDKNQQKVLLSRNFKG